MPNIRSTVVRIADLVLAPFVVAGGAVLRLVRRLGVQRLPISRRILIAIGVFPIRDHYGEPLFNPRHLRRPLDEPRELPGLDLNLPEQLERLERLRYASELLQLPKGNGDIPPYDFGNPTFGPGDSEYLYSLVRQVRPARVVEVGSGNSTRIAVAALRMNRRENPEYVCRHTCIEPYEAPWLESLGPTVLRERVERLDRAIFAELDRDDVLFIDSSHVIRPQGDVLCEYLEILPILKPGVYVHIHDIFTPRDVKHEWVVEHVSFMNEQYLLEAFLSMNPGYRVVAALNQLKHEHFAALTAACPVLGQHPQHEPGSFWIVRNG